MAKASGSTLPKMEKEDDLNLPLRGAGFSQEVIDIGNELETCLEEESIRSFPGVEADDKEKWARLIRRAGEHVGMDVATRYDKNSKKLYWGPEVVMKAKANNRSVEEQRRIDAKNDERAAEDAS